MESKDISSIFERHKNQEILTLVGEIFEESQGQNTKVQQLVKQIKNENATYQNQVRYQLTQQQKRVD